MAPVEHARELIFGFGAASPPPPAPPEPPLIIWFLNQVLRIVFPLVPWELFLIMPIVLAYLMNRALKDPTVTRGTVSHLLTFVTYFSALWGGAAHSGGLYQAVDTMLGGVGICAALPPRTLKDGTPADHWCFWMAVHILAVCPVGYFFIYLAINDRSSPTSSARAFYWRMTLMLPVFGFGQLAPYLFQFVYYPEDIEEILFGPGLYSHRAMTPGLTEFLQPCVWFLMTGYFYQKALSVGNGGVYRAQGTELKAHDSDREDM